MNTNTTTKTISTPRGKRLSPKQYVALVAAANGRGCGHACESGHFDCAAWNGGPCEHEVAANAGLIDNDDDDAPAATPAVVAPAAAAAKFVVEKNGPREYEKESRIVNRIYTGTITTWDVVEPATCSFVSEHRTKREAVAACALLNAKHVAGQPTTDDKPKRKRAAKRQPAACVKCGASLAQHDQEVCDDMGMQPKPVDDDAPAAHAFSPARGIGDVCRICGVRRLQHASPKSAAARGLVGTCQYCGGAMAIGAHSCPERRAARGVPTVEPSQLTLSTHALDLAGLDDPARFADVERVSSRRGRVTVCFGSDAALLDLVTELNDRATEGADGFGHSAAEKRVLRGAVRAAIRQGVTPRD